jgi:hypothetical protein
MRRYLQYVEWTLRASLTSAWKTLSTINSFFLTEAGNGSKTKGLWFNVFFLLKRISLGQLLNCNYIYSIVHRKMFGLLWHYGYQMKNQTNWTLHFRHNYKVILHNFELNQYQLWQYTMSFSIWLMHRCKNMFFTPCTFGSYDWNRTRCHILYVNDIWNL